MSAMGTIAAVVAAFLGASIWAVVFGMAEFEIGWLAWGIGALVGIAARLFEGEGPIMGTICALLAVAAIFFGKFFGIYMVLDEIVDTEVNQALYQEELSDARALVALDANTSYREFMSERRYTWEEGTAPEDITEEELTYFTEYKIPYLKEMAANPPAYEEWQSERRSELISAPAIFDMMQDLFGFLDLIFIALGVGTAFQIVNDAAD